MTSQTTQTLTEALAAIGVSHAKPKGRHDLGQRDLFAGDAALGAYDCFQAWTVVHQAQAAA